MHQNSGGQFCGQSDRPPNLSPNFRVLCRAACWSERLWHVQLHLRKTLTLMARPLGSTVKYSGCTVPVGAFGTRKIIAPPAFVIAANPSTPCAGKQITQCRLSLRWLPYVPLVESPRFILPLGCGAHDDFDAFPTVNSNGTTVMPSVVRATRTQGSTSLNELLFSPRHARDELGRTVL